MQHGPRQMIIASPSPARTRVGCPPFPRGPGHPPRTRLGRHTPPEVAKQALRLCCRRRRGAAMERTPARPGGAQEPPEEEEDDEVAQALQRTAVRAWAVGTFAAPPRKVGSKTCDKRTCTLAAAVLYDGEREVAFRNLQLEMRVE